MPPMTSTTTSARSTSDSASAVSSARSTTASRSASTSRTATPTSSRRRTDARAPGRRLRREQPHHLRADDAAAEDGDAQGRVGGHGRGHGTASSRIGRERPQDRGASRLSGRAVRAVGRSAEVERQQVVLGLAADEHPRRRRRRRRPPAGAARGCSWTPSTARRRPSPATASRSPARTSAGSWTSCTTMSPLSQCLPTTRASTVAGVRQPADDLRVVLRAVQGGADVVAHAAVDRHVGADACRRRSARA